MNFAACLPRTSQAPLLERWRGLASEDWLDDANRLAEEAGIVSGGGAPIRFRARDDGAGAASYERRIHDSGLVGCRLDPAGRAHDQLNAAVWLTLPATKAALNALHCAAGPSPSPRAANGRTRRRDLATLIDESGLAWLSTEPDCDALLRARAWQALFMDARARVEAGVAPIVVGHGLLGKLARPYKALTAQVLVVPVAAVPAVDPDRHIAAALVAAAGAIDDRAGTADRDRWPLLPLPVLALPGWCDENRDRRFFDDGAVFRVAAVPREARLDDPLAECRDPPSPDVRPTASTAGMHR